MLEQYLALDEAESDVEKRIKTAQAELEQRLYEQYGKITESELKSLVVDDKWMATIVDGIHSELVRVSQSLTGRVSELAVRYEYAMAALVEQLDNRSVKVNKHLTTFVAT